MKFCVKKMLLTIILCGGIVLATPAAQADAWGANQAAAVWTWVVNKIGRHIEGVMLGSLKMVAMNLMNSQIGQLIGGGGISGAPRFITNWQDALNVDPQRNAQLYMNDFFTLTTRGMASSANYVGAASSSVKTTGSQSGSGVGSVGACTGKTLGNTCSNSDNEPGTCEFLYEAVGSDNGLRCMIPTTSGMTTSPLNNPLAMGDPFALRAEGMTASSSVGSSANYAQYLQKIGKAAIAGDSEKTMTLNEFTSSPQAMFQQGDWRAFDSFVSNPLNNPYGYSIAAEQAYQTKLAQEKEIAKTEAIAYQGFKGTEGPGGSVTTPGITIKGLMDNANDFGNKIIAGASNPAELAGSLASAAVSKAINGLVNRGIAAVQNAVMKPINDLNRQVTSAINEVNGIVGPAAQLMNQAERSASAISGVLANSSGGAVTTNVGSVGACSGKVENDACMGSAAGTCKFVYESSGSDNGLRCLEGLDTTSPCASGVRDVYGGCAVENTPSAPGLDEACSGKIRCGEGLFCDGTIGYNYQKCRPLSERDL